MNMVKIAKKYNFDGWLINIENKIKVKKILTNIYMRNLCLINFINFVTILFLGW